MVGVCRAVVHLGAAYVREYDLLVARIFGDQALHLCKARRYTLLVCVIEGEAHAENIAAYKALADVGS